MYSVAVLIFSKLCGTLLCVYFYFQVREVVTDWKFPNVLKFRYNFEEELSTKTVKLKTGGMIRYDEVSFPKAYEKPFPLWEEKAKDIRKMLSNKAIPTIHHDVFEQYLSVT